MRELWHAFQSAAGFGGAFHWVILGFLLAAFLLRILVPRASLRINASLILVTAAALILFVASMIALFGAGPQSAAYKFVRFPGLMLQGIAFVILGGVLVFELLLPSIRIHPPPILCDVLLAIAYVVVTISILSRIGVNLMGLIATSAVVTAIIGFSVQDSLGNLMGGIALQLERSINVGDWIRLGDQEGMVREIRWRATTIETRNWDTIIIPNGQLMKGQVIVLGRRQREPQQHRQWVYFNVDYRHSPAEVIDAVESALRDEPITNVAAAPPIHCIMMDFKDSYGAYAVRYWLTDLAPNDIVNSIIRTRIYTALKRAGISPSIPAQTIFVTEDDETRRQRKQGEEAARRLAAIRAVELFNPLTDEEKEQLAQRLRPAPFSRGESLMRQGEQSSCLFILASGNAEVRISADGSSQSRRVAMVHAGDFLGEMGLMTGAPRSASVVATSDVAAWRLDKHAFDDIVQKRPQIAESISHILAHRRSELDAAKEGLAEAAMRERARAMQGDLLTRIRRFFTLDRQ